LDEEQMLIKVIAERVGNIIEREWAEIEMRNYREDIEALLQNRTVELAESEERLQAETRGRIQAEEELEQVRNENTTASK
jgi:C4-dicarboxylate-specific signal transduction histidine kinase